MGVIPLLEVGWWISITKDRLKVKGDDDVGGGQVLDELELEDSRGL